MGRLLVTTNIDIKAGTQSLLPPKPYTLNDVLSDGAPVPLYAIPPKGAKTIEILPSAADAGGAWAVSFVLISADSYDPPITYSVGSAQVPNPASGAAAAAASAKAAAPTTDGRWFSLEFPHLFLGQGAVKLLSSTPVDDQHLFEPQVFVFKNDTGNLVSASVYIGRTWVAAPLPKAP